MTRLLLPERPAPENAATGTLGPPPAISEGWHVAECRSCGEKAQTWLPQPDGWAGDVCRSCQLWVLALVRP